MIAAADSAYLRRIAEALEKLVAQNAALLVDATQVRAGRQCPCHQSVPYYPVPSTWPSPTVITR